MSEGKSAWVGRAVRAAGRVATRAVQVIFGVFNADRGNPVSPPPRDLYNPPKRDYRP